VAAAQIGAPRPELAPGKGLTIGGGLVPLHGRPASQGKWVAWYRTVALTENDARSRDKGECTFDLTFTIANTGAAATGPTPFDVSFTVDGTPVESYPGFTLTAGQIRTVTKPVRLKPGLHHQLTYSIDPYDRVSEVDETNNRVWVYYDLPGTCRATFAPPGR
jgi:CARDB